MNDVDAKEHLRRQLLFIQWSCDGYDLGHHEEALRIAVSLRVLFHHTENSHALIKQMDGSLPLHLLSTFRDRDSNEPEQGPAIDIGGTITQDGVTPELGESRHRRFMPPTDWWHEIVHTFETDFSRMDIVLSAANKDGGAHVHPKPSPRIQKLRDGVGTVRWTTDKGMFVRPLLNAHFYFLRQFGHEVLNSPELTSQSGEKPLDCLFFPRTVAD